jgi:hypothetical protein
MKARSDFSIKSGVNSTNLVTFVVTASIAFSGAQHPGAETVISERRVRAKLAVGEFGGGSELEPLPITDHALPVAAGTATLGYKTTWRSTPDEAVTAALKRAGIYWFPGGPTTPGGGRLRFHLKVDARNEDEALAKVRVVIERAGGDASDLEVHHPDPERIRAMEVAAREIMDEAQ